jgi:radical SAM protein with 4Fe4S-binding SPASM domain
MLGIQKNLLSAIYNLDWDNNIKVHPIQWLELEVTRRCPLSCLHCGSSCSAKAQSSKELSTIDIINICSKIASRYNPKKINIAITGGEPFARTDLLHLVANITEMGFRVGIITNGFYILDTLPKYLYAAGIRSMTVSLDGMEGSHNWLRNHTEAFRKAVNALKILKESKLFYVEAMTIVNKRNIKELHEMENLLSEIGVDGWRFGKTFPIGRAINYQELFIGKAELKYLLDFIKQKKYDKNRKIKDITYFEEGCYGNQYELEIRKYFRHCQAGVNILTVMADGSITGCAAASPDFIQGSIYKDDIIDTWENKFAVFRDRNWMKNGDCGGCRQWRNCRGDGIHLWKKDSLNPTICNFKLAGCK